MGLIFLLLGQLFRSGVSRFGPHADHLCLENVGGLPRFLNFSNLRDVSDTLAINLNAGLVSIRFPVLYSAGILIIFSNPLLTRVSLPGLTRDTESVQIVGNTKLTEISIPNYVPTGHGFFGGNALSAASVNHILSRWAKAERLTSGTLDLSGGTNSPPTGRGILDRDTLANRGIQVITNH